MIRKTADSQLLVQFKQVCDDFKQSAAASRAAAAADDAAVQCYRGLTPVFLYFGEMGFTPADQGQNESVLKTAGHTYTLTHGISRVGNDSRAIMRIESPTNKAFGGMVVSGGKTQSDFEIRPIKGTATAVPAKTVKTPQEIQRIIDRNLSQFDDLRPLRPRETYMPADLIPRARATMPPASGAHKVLPTKAIQGVLGRKHGTKPTQQQPDAATAPEPGKS